MEETVNPKALLRERIVIAQRNLRKDGRVGDYADALAEAFNEFVNGKFLQHNKSEHVEEDFSWLEL